MKSKLDKYLVFTILSVFIISLFLEILIRAFIPQHITPYITIMAFDIPNTMKPNFDFIRVRQRHYHAYHINLANLYMAKEDF
tara:strand:- start:701 stop:946 length:246 start_codon:yes stop_codon:yes gene_type:complete